MVIRVSNRGNGSGRYAGRQTPGLHLLGVCFRKPLESYVNGEIDE